MVDRILVLLAERLELDAATVDSILVLLGEQVDATQPPWDSLPALIGDALAANDRIKLRLSLLQEAALHVQMPNPEVRQFEAY